MSNHYIEFEGYDGFSGLDLDSVESWDCKTDKYNRITITFKSGNVEEYYNTVAEKIHSLLKPPLVIKVETLNKL